MFIGGEDRTANVQIRSWLPSRPRTFPPLRAPLLVMDAGIGWSTTLAWKSVTFFRGWKTVCAIERIWARRVALLAMVAVPNNWL